MAKGLQLKILHINDHHSHLQANSRGSLKFEGKSTRVSIGGFPRVVAKINELANTEMPVLKLHAGDAITGDLYYTLFEGEADAALMNEVCFDAFVLGNHEFDEGDSGLVRFLDELAKGSCNTQVLGANVIPEVGVSPLTLHTPTDYFVPYMVKNINGVKVGIIGIDIAEKTKKSSNPDATTRFRDEIRTAKQYITLLELQGIEHIILLTHYQYENDIQMARQLDGVDVIVGGDSHTLLGDFEKYGLNSQGPYPTITSSESGKKVCVVQAWEYSQVVGELDVVFDEKGDVVSCAGTPHLLIGESFKRKNADGKRVEIEGKERQEVMSAIEADAQISIVEPDLNATNTLKNYSSQVEKMSKNVIGSTTETLCLERVPGQGKSSMCAVSQTYVHGSDIVNLAALAFQQQSLEAEIAIQNAGGVRVDIPKGDLSIGLIYRLLPYKNTLVNLTITGQEIIDVLEDAIDFSLQPTGSTGAYPYASGLRFHVDASQSKGSRVSQVQVKRKGESSWSAIDRTQNYIVVTNDYVAGGKDGYTTFAKVTQEGRSVNTYLDQAQAFVDYVKAVGTLQKLPDEEYSTQQYTSANGKVHQ